MHQNQWKQPTRSDDSLGLTLQHDDYCVSYDAECGDENQNGEDVGTDGICQL